MVEGHEGPRFRGQSRGRVQRERLVHIQVGSVNLDGTLYLPDQAHGLVVFVHGSGSSRNSPRNKYVARELQERGLGTLLFDLLTTEEEEIDLHTRHIRFDIGLLARRTIGAVDWLAEQSFCQDCQLGFFGASTGAAAALIAAAERPELSGAVVSRGGRPDLAGQVLTKVKAPTLLIVGQMDYAVIELNRQAQESFNPAVEAEMHVITGASHLFEEPGALEVVAEAAGSWFSRHLSGIDNATMNDREDTKGI